jgi:hypothetical protein
LEALRKLVVDVAVVLVGVVLAIGVVQQLSSRAPVIEPISVPDRLADLGYRGEVVAARMIDRAREIERTTNADTDPRSAAATGNASPLMTVAVPGSNVSLAVVVDTARRLVGLPTERVSGEIVAEGPADAPSYRTTMRITGPQPNAIRGEARESIDQAIDDGARQLTGLLRPCALAALLLVEGDKVRSWRWLEACFEDPSHRDRDWAHVLRGMRLLEEGQLDEAIEHFKVATNITPTYTNALGEWAIALHKKGDIEGFRRKMDEIDAVRPRTGLLYVKQGNTLCRQGRMKAGLRAYRSAYDLDGSSISGDPEVRARKCRENLTGPPPAAGSPPQR